MRMLLGLPSIEHHSSRAELDSPSDGKFGGEFQRRAAFALLASLSGHDKTASDAKFLDGLTLIEHAASDDRNFVKKGVSWALRGTGRRNPKLRAAALALSRKLTQSPHASARWIGKDAIRDLSK